MGHQPSTASLYETEGLAEPEIDLGAIGLGSRHAREAAPEGDVLANCQFGIAHFAADGAFPSVEPGLKARPVLAVADERRRQ